MAFFLVCGTHTFTNPLTGYENVNARCQNCGNWSAHVVSRWEWFTVCFVPLIPFSFKPWHEVFCSICQFSQDLAYRQDIQSGQGREQGGPGPGQGQGAPQQQIPMHNYPPPQHQGQQAPYVQDQGPPQGNMQYKPPTQWQ